MATAGAAPTVISRLQCKLLFRNSNESYQMCNLRSYRCEHLETELAGGLKSAATGLLGAP